MTETHNSYELPPNLPVPADDGACRHLVGMRMPSVRLFSTRGRLVDVAVVSRGRAVIFVYPRTGKPGVPPPKGWDDIPGARGCTPECCAFRNRHGEFRALGFDVFGVSTQSPQEQLEFAERNHIPYEILSDEHRKLATALRMPTFEVEGMVLVKRLTLLVSAGRIRHAFYPIFPPDRHPEEVLAHVRAERL